MSYINEFRISHMTVVLRFTVKPIWAELSELFDTQYLAAAQLCQWRDENQQQCLF